MVIEGILTTENVDGSMHVSPIGPHVDLELSSWTLKPFQSSKTFLNLREHARAVFHVVDDPLLMAAAVLGLCNPSELSAESAHRLSYEQISELVAARFDDEIGWVLDLSCRSFGLSVTHWDVSEPRAIANCVLVRQEEHRAFWGWNRARHSILELAIIASRKHMLAPSEIAGELIRHKIIVEKTAGARENAAWELLNRHLSQ
jgi:uncharacterized protein